MPWAFDVSGLKRNFILWLLRRAEIRLERLKALRAADLHSLDQLREPSKHHALSRAKIEVYYDHHVENVLDWILLLDNLLARNAVSRMSRMTRSTRSSSS